MKKKKSIGQKLGIVIQNIYVFMYIYMYTHNTNLKQKMGVRPEVISSQTRE